MAGFFYNLGKKIGPKLRKANWVVRSLVGTEAESVKAEYAVGRDLAVAFLQEMEADREPALAEFLGDVGGRLVQAVKNRQWPFHFLTVRSVQINAFALPGGFIFLTRPLLELCRYDRDEVAFVLGHEMAHVVHRHAIDRAMANTVISATVGRYLPGGKFMRMPLGGIVSTLLSQGYSQDQELDADRLGVRLAVAAGFDGWAAARLLERLQGSIAAMSALDGYFSSHPPMQVRIEQITRLLR